MTKYYVDDEGNYIGGFDGAEPPAGALEVPDAPADARQKWADGVWAELTSVYVPPIPQLHCVATLDYDDFDINGVANGAGMSVSFMIDTGVMWVFFEESMPDATYPWNVSSSVGKANVTDRQPGYIEVTVTDDSGAPVSSASVSIQIFKVN